MSNYLISEKEVLLSSFPCWTWMAVWKSVTPSIRPWITLDPRIEKKTPKTLRLGSRYTKKFFNPILFNKHRICVLLTCFLICVSGVILRGYVWVFEKKKMCLRVIFFLSGLTFIFFVYLFRRCSTWHSIFFISVSKKK